MKPKVKTIISILFLVFNKSYSSVNAGHITYKWISGNTYQINFTIYHNTPDNYCEISAVCFGDGTTGTMLPRVNGGSTLCAAPAKDGVFITPTIKKSEYVTTHTYPGPGSYNICLTLSNRNAGVINISNSVNTYFYMESTLFIPTFSNGKNNSPTLNFESIVFGCFNNSCVDFNFSTNDNLDGDSLSYEIVPYTIPGALLPAASTSFSINPVTGILSWCSPTFAGEYNAIIKITEWRKDFDNTYYKIGDVKADVQFVISSCTSLSEESLQSILIYPNPSEKEIYLKLTATESYNIQLFDVSGKELMSQPVKNQANYVVDINEVPKGIYFLKITENNTRLAITKKVVKI